MGGAGLKRPPGAERDVDRSKEFPYSLHHDHQQAYQQGADDVPQAVRTALGLRAGDELAYVIEDSRVVLTRRDGRIVTDDPFAAFSEWDTAADAEAYAGL